MTAGNVWAVVPVKPFEAAKLRLAGVLASSERMQLARIMAEDVLDALAASKQFLAGILVVSADTQVAALAARRGAQVLVEPAPAGINQALTRAADHLSAGRGDSGMIVVPTDLPHITADAIGQLTDLLTPPRAVALVPATDDGGTNILACRPAGIIPPSFGPRSFERHRMAARVAGIAPAIPARPKLGRDIDRPGDLVAFLSLRTATRTHDYLASRGVAERLAPAHQFAGMQSVRFT